MKIQGCSARTKYKFSEVQFRHWHQFAESAGLSKAQTTKRVMDLAKVIPLAARKLQADFGRGFSENTLVEQIVVLIEQRCALTIKRLNAEAIQA
jgi:serine/threonine-protein kinase HipA